MLSVSARQLGGGYRTHQKFGEAGLKNAKSIPKNPANQTPPEIAEKVLYLRRKYHLEHFQFNRFQIELEMPG